MQFLYFLLDPLAIFMLPLIEVAAFTVYWRRSIENKWLFAILGCIAVYALAIATFWLVDKFSATHVNGYQLEPVKPGTHIQPEQFIADEPRLPAQFYIAMIAILLVSAAVLWGIKRVVGKV